MIPPGGFYDVIVSSVGEDDGGMHLEYKRMVDDGMKRVDIYGLAALTPETLDVLTRMRREPLMIPVEGGAVSGVWIK